MHLIIHINEGYPGQEGYLFCSTHFISIEHSVNEKNDVFSIKNKVYLNTKNCLKKKVITTLLH